MMIDLRRTKTSDAEEGRVVKLTGPDPLGDAVDEEVDDVVFAEIPRGIRIHLETQYLFPAREGLFESGQGYQHRRCGGITFAKSIRPDCSSKRHGSNTRPDPAASDRVCNLISWLREERRREAGLPLRRRDGIDVLAHKTDPEKTRKY